jgi:hypothetical protein
MADYAGGAFVPGATYTAAQTTASGASFTNANITGATISGTVTIAAGSTLTAPAIAGAATMASGAILTTPTIKFTAQDVIATGATGGAGAALSAIYPVIVTCNATGVSGAGVDLPTGAAVAGAWYQIINQMTGVLKIYAVGGTINGTTGTTAFSLTATGNKMATAICTVAGAWSIAGNT